MGFEGGEAIQVIARDISARKRAEEMHIRALAAEEEERLKANLLSTVSHELRTPLTAVRGYASTLLEYYDRLEREEIEDCIRGIDSAAQYLEKIVSDLLTLTRIESGVLHLDRHEMHLGEFLERTLSTHLVASPHLQLGLAVPAKDPVVSIDNVRLQQVVNNLVDNAFKYGGQDKPVSVMVRNRPQPTVIVRDRGPGVPDDALDRIFAPFVRLKGPETAAVSGSGLGLAVCRGIVEAHGGRIWAERPRGGGLQVSFTLPKSS
jgi:two-component system sensor histidine kinase KdpD